MLSKFWRSRRSQNLREDADAHGAIPVYSDSPLASAQDIYACFRLILGRNPNPEEEAGHFSRVGTELEPLVATYLNSLEFSRRNLIGVQNGAQAAYVQTSIQGFELFVDPDDEDVGKPILRGSYEPHVTAVFREQLAPGMRVVDLGANVGYFSMLAASIVGPQGCVLAFEPNPSNGRLLEASRRINRFDALTLYQVAASDRDGTLMLNATFSNGTTSAYTDNVQEILRSTSVPCLRLDTLLLQGPRVDFIKVDIEGAEYLALSGAQATLRRDQPVIVSEFSPTLMPGISGVSGPDYLRFLVGHGYVFSVITSPTDRLECGSDIQAVMNAYERAGVDHIDFLAKRG